MYSSRENVIWVRGKFIGVIGILFEFEEKFIKVAEMLLESEENLSMTWKCCKKSIEA